MPAASASPLKADPLATKDAELAPFEALPVEILAIIADAVAAQSGWDLLSLSRVSRRTRQAAHRAGRKALSRATKDIKLQDDLIQASNSKPIRLLQSCLRPMPPFGRRICEFLPESIDGPIIEPIQVKDRELRPTNLALDLFVSYEDVARMNLIDFSVYPPREVAIPVRAQPEECSTCIESSGYHDMFMMAYAEEAELQLQALSDGGDRLLLVSTPSETSAHVINPHGITVISLSMPDRVQHAQQRECSGQCRPALARSSGISEEWLAIEILPPKASGSAALPRFLVMRKRGKTLEWVCWKRSGPLGEQHSLSTGVVNLKEMLKTKISGRTSNMRLELAPWSRSGADDDPVVLVSWYERTSGDSDEPSTGNMRLLDIPLRYLVGSASTASSSGSGVDQHPREALLLDLGAPESEPGIIPFHIAPDGQTLRCVRKAADESQLLIYKRESRTEAWCRMPSQSVSLVKVYSMRAIVNGWLCLEARGTGFVKLVHVESSAVQTFNLLQESAYAARETDVLDIVANRLVYSEVGGKVHAILDLTGPWPVQVELISLIRQALPLGDASAAAMYAPGETRCECGGCTQERSHRSTPTEPMWFTIGRPLIDAGDDEDDEEESLEVVFLQLQPSSTDVKSFWMSPEGGLDLPVRWSHLRVQADLIMSCAMWTTDGNGDQCLADFRSPHMTRLRSSTAIINGQHPTDGELLFPFAAPGEPIWYRVRPKGIPIPDAEERVNHSRLKEPFLNEEDCCPQIRPLPDYHLPWWSDQAVYIGGVKRLLAFLEAECPCDCALCCRATPQIAV